MSVWHVFVWVAEDSEGVFFVCSRMRRDVFQQCFWHFSHAKMCDWLNLQHKSEAHSLGNAVG